MPTLNIFELRQRFRKSVECLWRYRIFAGTVYRSKGQYFKCCWSANFSPCHWKIKYLCTWDIPPKCPISTCSSWGKYFENRLSTFGDMGFLLAKCTGWKWQNFKCCRSAEFSPCRCKSKLSAHRKLSTKLPTLNIVELRQRFRKSVEYLSRYSIFAGTLYRVKVAKFQM